MEDADRHGRDEDREVEAERPDQEQHREDRYEVRAGPDVAQPFDETSLGAMRPRYSVKVGQAKGAKRDQHGAERGAVDQEGPAGPERGDDEPGDRGADHPRRVERGRVQRDGVRQVLIADQFADEGLARRGVERRRRAEQEGEHIDVPELHEAGDGEKPERRRERPHRRLRGHEELALIQAVGGRSGPRQEQAAAARTAAPSPCRPPRRCDG